MISKNLKFTPYWWDAAPRPQITQQTLPAKSDIVIVGSGFTGLSAALTLVDAGRSVTVVEAQQLGEGASTRNGGQVGPGNQHFSVAQLSASVGKEKAHALMLEGLDMLEYIANLVKREGIDCDFNRVGRFRAAVRPAHYDNMARESDTINRFIGMESFMVPRHLQHDEVGSDFYYGGCVLPNDASIHPGLYHQGLADRASERGVTFVDRTRVNNITVEKQGISIDTTRGNIAAKECVVATNGYTTSDLQQFYKRLMFVGSDIIATEPLSAEMMNKLLPKRRVMGESRRVFHYYRPSPDGTRILFGGRKATGAANSHKRYLPLYQNLLHIFPDLEGIKISHCWSGRIAYTNDTHPHLGKVNGIHYAMGYCGTGVSRATYFGHKIALQLMGDANGITAFDDLEFSKQLPLYRAPGVVSLGTAYKRLLDKFK